MEYSVYDLIRTLLKKWYVILITMILIGSISIFLSQRSFSAVQENYEEFTTQTIPAETNTGTYTAVYQCRFQMNSYEYYRTLVEQSYRFLWDYIQETTGLVDQPLSEDTLYSMAEEAYDYAYTDFQTLLDNTTEILPKVQAYAEEAGYLEPPVLFADGTTDSSQQVPLVVSDHLSVSVEANGLLSLTATGLTEEMGSSLINHYIAQVQIMGEDQYDMAITAVEQTHEFTQNRNSYTDDAILSQTVMKEPESAPSVVKAAATGAAFGFVLACFGVLLFTFIRDSRMHAEADIGNDGHA